MEIKRPSLPPVAAVMADQIDRAEVLGASRNVQMIGEILSQVAAAEIGTPREGVRRVRSVANYFVQTRGQTTQAVTNSLLLLLEGLDGAEDVAAFIDQRRQWLHQEMDRWSGVITQCGANLLADGAAVLAYDYSSSVAAILKHAAEQGKQLQVILPESRTLNGGRPYLRELEGCGHRLACIPDSGMGHVISRCSAVLEGVETLCADGSFYNTLGSLTAAVLAAHYRVPYHAATSLIKLDLRTMTGRFPSIPHRDFSRLYGPMTGVEMSYPENERVPPDLVTLYLTEHGVVSPGSIAGLARELAERLQKVQGGDSLS
jgi:ribose 1,5-bisphosphate isomerase